MTGSSFDGKLFKEVLSFLLPVWRLKTLYLIQFVHIDQRPLQLLGYSFCRIAGATLVISSAVEYCLKVLRSYEPMLTSLLQRSKFFCMCVFVLAMKHLSRTLQM